MKNDTIKEKDFVTLNYVGKLHDSDDVFDYTDPEYANMKEPSTGPITIIVGAGQVIAGLDKRIIGMKVGEEKNFVIPPSEAFGRREGKLVRLVPMKIFRKEGINPFPSMTVNIGGVNGRVHSVSSGRILVDFNHPLAGRDVEYTVRVEKKVINTKEKIEAIVSLYKLKPKNIEVEGDNVSISLETPCEKEIVEAIENDIKKYLSLKKIRFL